MDKLYLAHPYGVKEYVREKQVLIESETGINLYNPFYDGECIDELPEEDEFGINKSSRIVGNDKRNIVRCDGMVCYLPANEITIGTPMEMEFAFREIPIYTVTNEYDEHPWVKNHSIRIFEDFDLFSTWLRNCLEE